MGAENFQIVSRGGMAWLEATRFSVLPWLVHGFSTRQGGTSQAPCAGLNLGLTSSDRRERVEENRRRFYRALGGNDFTSASVRQVHSSHSLVVTRAAEGAVNYHAPGTDAALPVAPEVPAADGLITHQSGILLTIRIADCLPVLLVDAQQRVVAAVHAGWRGALARVIEKAVGDLRRNFGCDPQTLLAAVGPSIRACCYEVGAEVVEAFHASFTEADQFFQPLVAKPAAADRYQILFMSAYPPGHAPEHAPAARLDLTAVARRQLLAAGLAVSNIEVADYCTSCRTDLFFSHRREGPATGRQVAVIGVRG